MKKEIIEYNSSLGLEEQQICDVLASIINETLTDATYKIWHAHPVWFINENPIVGYSKQKAGIRLMFWSGKDFEEKDLNIHGAKFKDASVFFNHADEINSNDLKRWLQKSRDIQWDYKNIVKRKGVLERLK